jgi:hypothetical protein
VLAGTDQKDSKEAEEKTLISEWRSLLKKCLTGPTLLEMSGFRCRLLQQNLAFLFAKSL